MAAANHLQRISRCSINQLSSPTLRLVAAGRTALWPLGGRGGLAALRRRFAWRSVCQHVTTADGKLPVRAALAVNYTGQTASMRAAYANVLVAGRAGFAGGATRHETISDVCSQVWTAKHFAGLLPFESQGSSNTHSSLECEFDTAASILIARWFSLPDCNQTAAFQRYCRVGDLQQKVAARTGRRSWSFLTAPGRAR